VSPGGPAQNGPFNPPGASPATGRPEDPGPPGPHTETDLPEETDAPSPTPITSKKDDVGSCGCQGAPTLAAPLSLLALLLLRRRQPQT
jgi:MYXO-CTERM domain-containing protein